MTAKATPKPLNAFQQRHKHRSDMTVARIRDGVLRGVLANLDADEKEVDAALAKLDIDVVRGVEGAEEKRDALRAPKHEITQSKQLAQHDVIAVAVAIQESQASLAALYNDPEAFEQFVKEAEAATAAAVRDLARVPHAVNVAAQSWGKATSLWNPLNRAIQNRLEELNADEGRFPDVAPQASTPPFPVRLLDLTEHAPRPRGIERLWAARKIE